jgi:outer membrane receptor protein involved in Fe transport
VRGDLWSAFVTESQISPRINFVYSPLKSTTLHVGYGRYFTPPPLELIQGSDLSKFSNTTNGVSPFLVQSASAVKSERYDYFDGGLIEDVTSNFHVGVDAYYKAKKNVLDEGQFGPAMIFSPNNAAKGIVRGIEFTTSYDSGGFSAWGNLAHSRTIAYGLTSGQWQFDSDELAYLQSHWYHLDHDQDWTASAGMSYKWERTQIYADTLYGSGLYSGFANETELPSYETFDIGMTHDFELGDGSRFRLRFDITNVTDLQYEIRDGSGIGVFAPQYLPRRAFYMGISKKI